MSDTVILLQDNPHKLTLVMTPTDDFAEKRTLQESQLLENMVSRLTDQDKADIYEKGKPKSQVLELTTM